MKSGLDKYKKGVSETKLISSSVSISEDQRNFVRKQGLNLSLILRDRIDELMAKESASKPKKSKAAKKSSRN